MSIAALNWAFRLVLGDASAKAVLVAIADHADEDGRCWPSATRLALFTDLSERTVRSAVDRLQDMGVIELEDRAGRSPMITVKVGATPATVAGVGADTPAAAAPLRELQGCGSCRGTPANDVATPAAAAPEPSGSTIEPPADLFGGEIERQPATRRATRLPADWEPDASGVEFCRRQGLEPAATLEHFRDYWSAAAGAKGVKLDWPATWRNWCRSSLNRPRAAGGYANGRPRGGRLTDGSITGAVAFVQRQAVDADDDG